MYSSQKTNNQTTTKFSIHRKGKGVNAKTPVTLSIAFMIELNTLYKTHLNTWKRKKEKKKEKKEKKEKKRKKRKKNKKNKKKKKKRKYAPFTHPFSNLALPAYDGGVDPGMRLDHRVCQQGAPLETHAILDHHSRTHHHVGSDATVAADLRRGILWWRW